MSKLKIGLFFDGTACNAYNALNPDMIGSDAKSALKNQIEFTRKIGEDESSFADQIEEVTIIPANYLYTESTSSIQTVSNIWHLYQAYKTGKTEQGYQLGIYIEGVGTETGKSSDDLFSEAVGWNSISHRGVIDKTDNAIKYLREGIEAFNDIKGKIFDSIEFELFGFSRGSTSARHFANRLKNKDNKISDVIKSYFTQRTYPDIINKPVGKISFIGLFDSVAAILSLSEFDLDVNDSNTGDVNVQLDSGIADNIFHITAGNELRYNFSLNRILPNYTAELALPGSHADIGGGNIDNSEESFFISYPFHSTEAIGAPVEKWNSYIKADALRNRLKKHPSWGGIFSAVDISLKSDVTSIGDNKQKTQTTILFQRKNVRVGIEHVSLQAMLRYAQLKGVLFNKITDTALDIPSDLQDLAKKAFSAVDSISEGKPAVSLVNELSPALGKKYVFCSSFITGPIISFNKGDVSPNNLQNAAWYNVLSVMRPTDDYLRSEFDSYGKTIVS